LKWCRALSDCGARRIIYHFEIEKDHGEIISEIKQLEVEAGMAVNPETSLEALESFVEQLDVVLFLAVNPGFYGAPFIPEVLEKMRAFKEKHPGKRVGIDGGIKLNNVIAARKAGADYICVGSAILKDPGPQKSYKKFLEVAEGIYPQ
jgi:ribulose-phosphate 3-epimerase